VIGFASHCFGWLIGLVLLLSPPEIPNKIRVPTVRFLSVNAVRFTSSCGTLTLGQPRLDGATTEPDVPVDTQGRDWVVDALSPFAREFIHLTLGKLQQVGDLLNGEDVA
jgi:hypothetical protein